MVIKNSSSKNLFLFGILLTCAANGLNAQPWSGVLSPSRGVNWSPGVAGGIPTNRTQCGGTISAYNGSPNTINSAIAACGPNQFVQLGAGTFNLNGGILFNSQSNVTLRGMGADTTFLIFSGTNSCQGTYADVCVQSYDVNWKGGPSNLANWTAGYAAGATTISLSATPNLVIGNPIILDQFDDNTDNGAVTVCAWNVAPLICSLQENNGGGQRTNRNQSQIVTVAGCDSVTTSGHPCASGANITISPGLYMPNWNACQGVSGGCSPQAWWATNPITGVGVENMSLDHTNSQTDPQVNGQGIGVEFFNATNSWVTGVRDIDSHRAHVQAQYSARITVRNNYWFLTQNSIDQSYGFECYDSSDDLVENNIAQAVSGPLTINGDCSGTVLGYNFDINNFYTGSAGYINAMSNVHTAGTDNVLYEGNIGPQIYGDVFHGSHNFITLFRNQIIGNQPACWVSGAPNPYPSGITFGACSGDQSPLQLLSYSRFFNIIGNVLGQTGIQNTYGGIYSNLGNGNSANGTTVPPDPNVALTLYRWANYDTVNATVRYVASEVPSGLTGAQAPYAQPVPSTQALPSSFYYSSKPSWWPSSKPWPLIGPDVTGGNVPGVAGHANTNPAEDCFLNVMNGPSNGTGPVLSFNASACYGGGKIITQVAPPTNLTAVAK
jgi:hypothetical protein